MMEDDSVIAGLIRKNSVPTLEAVPDNPEPDEQPTFAAVPYRQIHRPLMHAGRAAVEEACRQAGIQLTGERDDFCEGCVKGKMHGELGKQAPNQTTSPIDFIRVDLVTRLNPGHLGYKYSLHIIDTWSNYY